MPRDRRDLGHIPAEYAQRVVEQRRADGVLPAYYDRLGFYERPHVQWSKRPKDRRDVFVADDFTCQICSYRPAAELIPANYDGRNTIGDLVVDHVISLRAGGTSARDNLQTLCKRCNGKKN